MNSRSLRILLLLFVAVWFGAIVPGHTRGQISLPGTTAPSADGKGAHGSCCSSSGSKKDSAPAKKCCAVCFFAAALMHTPPVSFNFADLGLVGSLAPPSADRIVLPTLH